MGGIDMCFLVVEGIGQKEEKSIDIGLRSGERSDARQIDRQRTDGSDSIYLTSCLKGRSAMR